MRPTRPNGERPAEESSDNARAPDDLRVVESTLNAFQPRHASVHRDQIMYEAGFAAGRREREKEQVAAHATVLARLGWPVAGGISALSNVVLLSLLVLNPVEYRPDRTVSDTVASSPDVNADEAGAVVTDQRWYANSPKPSSWIDVRGGSMFHGADHDLHKSFVQRRRVLQFGIDVLPPPVSRSPQSKPPWHAVEPDTIRSWKDAILREIRGARDHMSSSLETPEARVDPAVPTRSSFTESAG